MNPQALQAMFAALGQQLSGLSAEVVLLTQAVAAGNQNPQRNPGGPRPAAANPVGAAGERAAGLAGGVLTKVFGVMAAKLALILGPLVALGTVLSQTNSGFGVFQKAIGVFAASIAPLLLPIFILLGAAIMTVADNLWEQLLPKLKTWYVFVGESMIPALTKMVTSIGEFTKAAIEYADWLNSRRGAAKDNAQNRAANAALEYPGLFKFFGAGGFADKTAKDQDALLKIGGRVYGGLARQQDEWRQERRRMELDGAGDAGRRVGQAGTGNVDFLKRLEDIGDMGRRPGMAAAQGNTPARGNTPPRGPSAGDVGDAGRRPGQQSVGNEGIEQAQKEAKTRRQLIANAQLMIQSLRMAAGSQASIGGASDLQNKAIMASLQDPIEAKMRERTLKALDEQVAALKEIEKNTKPPAQVKHPGPRESAAIAAAVFGRVGPF